MKFLVNNNRNTLLRWFEQIMAHTKQAQPRRKAKEAAINGGKDIAVDAGPVQDRDRLRPAQRRFCQEYVLDWNGTQAAIRAGYSPKTAGSQAHDLLKKPEIRAEIGYLERAAAEKLAITHTDLIQRLWGIATGDVNDLVRVERRCCRFCHGDGHEYQWKTKREYDEAVNRFLHEISGGDSQALCALGDRMDAGQTIPGMPSDAGGFGFDATAEPNIDCTECHGEGIETMQLSDTREALSHPLYEGVKQTKDGIEVKIADRAKALEQVARHLSFFKDAVQVSASEELLQAARNINAASPPIDANYMRDNAHRLADEDEGRA